MSIENLEKSIEKVLQELSDLLSLKNLLLFIYWKEPEIHNFNS